jgi:heat-inducible transcriptional repressor
MAALEEAGYIAQPHTSAGRVPTDAGYRVFVDQLATVKPLSAAERRAMQTLLDGAIDFDDIVVRAVRALAQLTHQVAVIQYPSLRSSQLRYLELVDLGGGRVLLVIITENGRVEQHVVGGVEALAQSTQARLRGRINEVGAGRPLAGVAQDLLALVEEFSPTERPCVKKILDTLVRSLADDVPERLALAGTPNLARAGTEFARSLSPVLEAIEEQVVLLKLLSEMAEDNGDVAIRIGHENAHSALTETSLVTTAYGPSHMVARLGVLGPTRMDYPSSIAVVRAIARYLSRILSN